MIIEPPMKLKPWRIARALCMMLLTTSLFVHAQQSDELMFKAVSKLASDWSVIKATTDLSPAVTNSWLPDSGIRGRYQVAKKELSIRFLEYALDENVFLSGPHSEDLNLTSKHDFGRYNPAFLDKLHSQLSVLADNPALVGSLQSWYDRELKQYLRLYLLAHNEVANDQDVMAQYLSVIKNKPTDWEASGSYFLQQQYHAFSEQAIKDGYDMFEASAVPGFWIRRSIDGTEDEFLTLLKLVILTFDYQFLVKQHAIKKTPKPSCLQESQTLFEFMQCPNLNYNIADTELNRVYGLLRDNLKADKILGEKLKASQRLWVKLKQSDLDIDQAKSLATSHGIAPQPDYQTMMTLKRLATLKEWLSREQDNHKKNEKTVEWKKIPDVAQYKGADWKNEVLRKSNLTVDQAKIIAASNPDITFFFFMKRGRMHLEGKSGADGWNAKGTFIAGDAVFFSGQSWYGSAPGFADAYEKIN